MDRTEIRIIFIFELDIGHIASETSRNIIFAKEKGMTCEGTVQCWFEKIRSKRRTFEVAHLMLTITYCLKFASAEKISHKKITIKNIFGRYFYFFDIFVYKKLARLHRTVLAYILALLYEAYRRPF